MGQQQFKLILLLTGWLCLLSPVWADAPANWQALTPAQQAILAPVKSKWADMSGLQRTRLLAVAGKYPTLKPEQQKRFQKRLIVWSTLTPAQRDLARKNYQKLKHLPKYKRQIVKHRLMQTYPAQTSHQNTGPTPATAARVAAPAANPTQPGNTSQNGQSR